MSAGFCLCDPFSPSPCERCFFPASDDYNERVNFLQDPLLPHAQAAQYSSTEGTTTYIDPMLCDQAITDGSVAEPTYYQTAYTSAYSGTTSNPINGDLTYVHAHVAEHENSMAETVDNSPRICEWKGCDGNTEFKSEEALDIHVKDQHLSRRHALFDEDHIVRLKLTRRRPLQGLRFRFVKMRVERLWSTFPEDL
ncbi:hypothetical protein BDV09DRAFT_192462 [Aspergillus tetrazonus]